jgi:hypothetical protein
LLDTDVPATLHPTPLVFGGSHGRAFNVFDEVQFLWALLVLDQIGETGFQIDSSVG